MKISETKKNLIKFRRSKKDLRGKIKNPDISDKFRVRLKEIYLKESRKMETLVKQKILPLIPSLVVKLDTDRRLNDKFKDAFRAIFIDYFGGLVVGGKKLNKKEKEIKEKLGRVIRASDRDHKKDFNKMFNKIAAVQPLDLEKETRETLELSIRENTDKITTVAKKHFSDIEEIVMNGLRSGVANKSIIAEIEEKIISKVDNQKANAKLIATDQIQKLNGQLDKVRQINNGGRRYIWRTRRNQAVRDDHVDLEGAILEWGHPPITVTTGKRSGERNEPGQDINCKCQAEMVIEDLLGERTNKIIKAEEKTQKLIAQGRL